MKKLFCKTLLLMLFLLATTISYGQIEKNALTMDSDLIRRAYDSTKITYIKGSLPPEVIKKKPFLRIEISKGKIIRGYLLAHCKDGLFMIDKNNTQFSYCDYKNIKAIYFGRSYGHWVAMTTAGVAGIATILTLGSDYALLIGFAAGFYTSTFGQLGIGLTYGVYKGVKHCHWRIKFKRKAGEKVTDHILKNRDVFSQIQEVDSITQSSNEIKKNNQINIQDSSKIEIVKSKEQTELPIQVEQPKVKVSFLEGLNFEKENAVSIQWMLKNFDSKSVNESVLMKSFKNIKGLQIMPEQLYQLNNSSIQFLAIIIGESAGYDIKSIVELTDKQKKEIIFYEPSILDAVHIQSTIDKTYLSEIDLQNLQVLFNELKGR